MSYIKKASEFFTPDVMQRAGCVDGLPASNPLVSGLVYDSRKVQAHNCYFALSGLHVDGHRFVSDAIARGASLIVHQDELPLDTRQKTACIRVKDSRFAMAPIADAFYGSPSQRLALIGVTGTEGKSTTVYLIYQLLRLLDKKTGFISTVQYSDGGDVQWNSEHQTTPEAPIIHEHLARMRDSGAEYAVVEASSHGLSEKTMRLGNVAFDVGVLTNVTHEHLEFHGTWEQYRFDKANLFRALDRVDHRKGSVGYVPSFGVVNADDKSAAYFTAATKQPVYTYSTAGADADLMLQAIESHAQGNRYTALIRETGETIAIEDQLPGAFNAGNTLAALLVVSGLLAMPIKDIVPFVRDCKPVRGRMTAIQKGQDFELIVDYAHTPSSFETIFPPLRKRIAAHGGRIISLFGSAGDRDVQKRSVQGRIAAEWSDIVILTDEDPRSEVPMAILEDIARGIPTGRRGEALFLIPDRPAAIRKAFSLAQSGDLVLLLGKGHENSIIYADKTMAYDEITEAERALTEQLNAKTESYAVPQSLQDSET
ncbi:MAG: UDP-N-acetylmuramoyl-L-alanyl-D-glutamate--2,6-diaminopimelate ligase [Treponema sp.]|jgi:UDP-N-acetylmuramoyl-L-alanyl-D-glutamate--2,6-diaminopimelate ligase|nr:UDP-N-acetylmuramoyl-L-alanyl-D-glutamate--2,6-diaminopimelate ligase [Treponema sp.]